MKLHTANVEGLNQITAYGEGYVAVNGHHSHTSLIVTPTRVIPGWPVDSIDIFSQEALEILAQFSDHIILLGTGRKQRFPSPQTLRPLIERRVSVEIMDTFAACRTFNILMGESRIVAAALIIEAPAA